MQPRVEGPFIIPPTDLAKFGSENSYPNVPQFPAYGNGDCPILPQTLMPSLKEVKNFIQGPVLYKGAEIDRREPPIIYSNGHYRTISRYAEIERKTVIFTPNALGRYDNKKTGNHITIFLRYWVYKEENGIFVIDQYFDRDKVTHKATTGIRFIRVGIGSINRPSNDARAFAVVLAMRPS